MTFKRKDHIFIEHLSKYVLVAVTAKDKEEYGVGDENSRGMCYRTTDDTFILGLPLSWDETTVWHEAHHLSRFLNQAYGILTTNEEHEADAYLQEYIVKLLKINVYNRKV